MRAEKKKCRKDDYSIKASTGGSDCTDRPVQAGKAAYTKHLQGGETYQNTSRSLMTEGAVHT